MSDDMQKRFEAVFRDKTIMITGGLGFIGSNLAHRLVRLNPKKIIIIDNLSENSGGNVENIKEIKEQLEIPYLDEGGLNISDPRVRDYLSEVDYIFNLAGSVNHLSSKNDPLNDLKINLMDHVAFLETCKKYLEENKNRKFNILFTGTRDIYGKTLTSDVPLKEDFLIKEVADPQGIHNHSTEFHHLWYGKELSIPIISLRLSNTYGPRQKIINPGQGFLGYFIYQSLTEKEIELWGGGVSLRDFNYVEDVIDAMFLAISSDKSGIYNLGGFIKKEGRHYEIGGNICSVGEAAKRVIEISGQGSFKEIAYPEEKKSIEAGHVYIDSTKMYNEFGWYPKTSFEEGVRKTISFYKANPNYLEEKELVNNIPFLDLKKQHKLLKEKIDGAIKGVINRSHFVLGQEVSKFEEEFARYCNKDYAIGVNSGTDALKIALKALGVGLGDEVIVPTNTAIPTVMAIKEVGAEPCLIDCNEDYLIDVNKIEEKITEKTKAIMPVHLYGQACDMDRILEIANRYNLEVVEDCCQAHGAEYRGRKVPIGEIGCFSFYPSKNLGSLGEGGAIVTSDFDLDNKIRLLRNYGQSSKYHADIHGFNSRLHEIQAAVLRVKLEHLDEFNEKRRRLALLYDQLLENVIKKYSPESVYHLYVVRVKERDRLIEYLKSKEIGSLIHYPIPIHLQKAFAYLGHKEGEFPNAEKYAKEIISLPIFPEMKEEEVRRVCKEITNFYQNFL